MSRDVNDLFDQAVADGDLSRDAATSLSAVNYGTRIQDAMGIRADDFEESEAFLLALLLDDSSSIRFGANTDNVRKGYNGVLEALDKSRSRSQIQVMSTRLNRGLLHGFVALADAERLSTSNYDPSGGTPLYDSTVEVLGTIVAKEQEYKRQGIPVRTVTVIVSDGADCVSQLTTASDVATIVRDLLKLETHIVMAIGIDDGATDFVQVFTSMGIPKEWILTPANDPHEIRNAFGVVSRASLSASQGADAFSQTMAGGFAKTS
jgi:hypothetical protein